MLLQDANPIDGELDRVAALEKAPNLQPAAIADGAGAENLARVNRLVLRRIGENLLERKEHLPRVPRGARLAVHPDLDLERLGIADLVGGHDPGAEHIGAVEALALRGSQSALHFDRLPVTGGEIVEDRIAEDMRGGFAPGNVGAGAPCNDRDLELVIHHLAVARPVDRRPGSDHREPVGDVIDGQLAIDRRKVLERLLHDGLERFGAICAPRLDGARAAPGLPDVKGEGHRVAHLTGLRQRREKLRRRQDQSTDRSQRRGSPRARAPRRGPPRPRRSGTAWTGKGRRQRRRAGPPRQGRTAAPLPRPRRRSWRLRSA